MDDKYNIFGLSASQKITEELCKKLKTKQHIAKTTRFADGEILVQAKNSVRKKELFVIQSTNKPVNENLMELLIALDAFKRASAEKINVIIPYFGYARQDRKADGRQPITAKLVANLIERAGANRAIFIDLHSSQSMGFFDIPVDNISSSLILAEEIVDIIIKNNLEKNECVLVSPDHGGLTRIHNIAKYINDFVGGVAVIAKRRPEPNKSEVEFVLGNIKDKICFISDDMIDTGGTICNAARALKKDGAKDIYILACHGLFNGDAKIKFEELIKEKIIKGIVVTNTIELSKDLMFEGLKVVSVVELLKSAIESATNGTSFSVFYQKYKEMFKKKYIEYKYRKK